MLELLGMRSLNRVSQYRIRHVREHTQSARLNVDQLARRLAALQYERSYIERQIARCLEFRSADEQIALVPLDEFYALAPPEIAKPARLYDLHFITHYCLPRFPLVFRLHLLVHINFRTCY